MRGLRGPPGREHPRRAADEPPHQVHANLVEAIAREDADRNRTLIAGHSLPTASDADR